MAQPTSPCIRAQDLKGLSDPLGFALKLATIFISRVALATTCVSRLVRSSGSRSDVIVCRAARPHFSQRTREMGHPLGKSFPFFGSVQRSLTDWCDPCHGAGSAFPA